MKILVVDDDSDLRSVIRGVLEPVGTVIEAADGDSALRALASEKPAVMLLDVTMPGESGLSVLSKARASAPNLIVVMLTGEMDLRVARTALEQGARSYITKPFDPEALREEIRRLTRVDEVAGPGDPPWRVVA
jgi:DNA-binding response OmpR family regulator